MRPHHYIRRMVQLCSLGGANVPSHEGTLAPPGEYDWTYTSFMTRVHNPNDKSIDSAVFCTALGRKSLYLTMRASFPKIAFSILGSGTPSKTGFLGHIWAHNPNGISNGSAVFCTDDRSVPILYNGMPLYHLKIASSHGGIWTPI